MSLSVSEVIRLPCTCEIWSDKGNGLKRIRQAVNDACKAQSLGIVCHNISATVTHQLSDDLLGAWALEMSDAGGAHLEEDNRNLQCFLRMINGEVLGVAPDFVRVTVVHNHSHRDLE